MSDAAAERLREALNADGSGLLSGPKRSDVEALLSEREADKKRIAELERVEAMMQAIRIYHRPVPEAETMWCATCTTEWPCRTRKDADHVLRGALVEEETTDG